ncbi:Hypothetical predicted protein [Mytilus galloprovincialis]|uniref:Uncharacterized protein n=1 Tax=Mytilus galloprovincialis TaxID=29158 RepID=A0A8B6EHJ7_MYTGA|nr:Hypothetical predicted protein [Mytilus galloprovincialis]
MQSLLCFVLILVSLYSVQGRTYGYQKKTKRAHVVKAKDPIGFPTDQVHIPKEPVVLPSQRLPNCDVGCTLQIIPPECIQETFGFEHGVRCRGAVPNGKMGAETENINSRIGGEFVDSLGGGRNQNLNSRIGGEFVDSLGSDFFNERQNSNLGGRFRNRQDTNFDRRNRLDRNLNDRRNRQVGSGWL